MSQSQQPSVTTETRSRYQDIGLVLGPALFATMMLFANEQEVMEPIAWKTAAVGMWMAAWWATEALPVAVTAFLPLVIFAPLGIAPLKEAASHYANPIIYLYLGGFLMALAVERWNLHRRIALTILSFTGTDGKRLIGGFMLSCALLSMWMTNTSTTMMLLPIALSVVTVIADNLPDLSARDRKNFQAAMLLGLAYSATIGGLATLVGTPPNALLAAFLSENYGYEISFARWMVVGVPVSILMLPVTWFLLTNFLFPVNIPASENTREHLKKLRKDMGPMSVAEKRVALLFALVILAWLLRRPLVSFWGLDSLSDPGIVMTAAMVLFLLPSGDKRQPQLMTWHEANRLPWSVLLLFGGGLSLAAAVAGSGLAQWLGQSLAPLGTFGTPVLVLASCALVIFLTELTSNLATTATLLPVMGAIAVEAGIDPLILCVPITLAASCAFMLPVATPPNAIVFASGFLKISQMARAGSWINLIGTVVLVIVSLFLVPLVLGE
ncbi:SLC13 family permease [Emcibacter sp.]|uniref:SLC13 family permease n=1 Tax=Emcibacter sp. TaxID=1979954 RepID=UPI003A92803C